MCADVILSFKFLIIDTVFCSEPVPDNSANAVKVAVAKNFDELVADSKKVSFGNCHSFRPKRNRFFLRMSG
jgi:hypothetical protein